MSLKFIKVYDIDSNSSRYIESVSDDLTLLTNEVAANDVNLDSRPYHWRCDFGDFPSLDISIDSETGILKEVTIFIRKSDISSNTEIDFLGLPVIYGYPMFNTDIWGKHEFYHDECADVTLSIFGRDLCILKRKTIPVKRLIVNKKLDILIDENSLFIGVVFKDLSEIELSLITCESQAIE